MGDPDWQPEDVDITRSRRGSAVESADLPRVAPRRNAVANRGDKRRAALLTALGRLIQHAPLSRISVADIAAEAGVGRSAFYFYYSSKAAAVSELLWDVFEEMLQRASSFLDHRDTPRDAISQSIRGVAESWRANRHLMMAMLEARDADIEVRELWEAWIGRFVDPIAAAIDEERVSGRAPSGPGVPDPRALAAVLIGANERALERLFRTGATDEEVDLVLEALTSTWHSTVFGSTTA